MKETLHKFTKESLFDASASLLDKLHIKFSPQTKAPIPFESLYSSAISSSMPKSLAEVVRKIADFYIIGSIDEESLKGHESTYELGAPIDGKYLTMLVFGADVRHGETLTRSELATLTRGFNRIADSLPVILFVRNGKYLSLSTCERSQYSQQWREGEKLGKVSILRDINCEKPHRGHLDILASLGDKAYPTFDELYKHWLDVFSSELLTKKFYTELSEWYAWVINSGDVKFPNDITTTDDDMKYNHEAVIRLITRLIFVWFLKQKNLIPSEFFDEKAIREYFIDNFDPHSTNTLSYNPKESKYYRLILQNLFFAMLNRPIVDEETGCGENRRFATEKRYRGINPDYNINNLMRYRSEFRQGGADKLLEIANSTIPFLNGGLFECLDDKDAGKYYDGFSERRASLEQLSFPDYFFFGEKGEFSADLTQWYDDKKKKDVKVTGLINILQHYNFTVEENTPLDQEVSLDPELLGKVFENLLASYNPETNTSARKQTGSFYTPREIVKYMVDESLIAHLCRKCEDMDESVFRNLLDYSVDNFDMPEADRKKIMQGLYECKVLDPACGSGAFPMGMLQQMVHILRKLDPTNEMWREFILELALAQDKAVYQNIEDEEERRRLRKDIEQAFNRNVNDPDYARKLYLIENCIYGVDIQPIAVQISKLRFFISLVAEQKSIGDPNKNFGIRPLPNLEAKFVAANTLIPLEKEQNLFGASDSLENIKKQLSQYNHKLFTAKRNRDKKEIRRKIAALRKEYSDELLSLGSIGPSSAAKIAEWNMFEQNVSASFFDSEWMFGNTDGFDIVIGNPPYIQLQKATGEKDFDKKGKEYDVKLGDLYVDYKYETFAKTGDIYCLFYEQGIKLCVSGGVVCYITSNKWMRAAYGEHLRNFFHTKTNPKILIDFGGIQVFETATVDTNILLISKAGNSHNTLALTIDKSAINSFNNLSDLVQQKADKVSFSSSESWVILSPIEQSIKRKIESRGVPLKDWNINIYRGVLTGYNEAFIISTEKRNEILSNCASEDERKRTEELIRPILRGRDIKRYGYDWAGLYLIATFPSRHYDIEQYPAIKTHLLSFGMERLEQTGIERIVNGQKVKARKKTNNQWFETQDSISYWDDFSKPKLFYADISQKLSFALCQEIMFCNNTTYFISSQDPETLEHLKRYLNSPLIDWYYRTLSVQLGQSAVRMFSIYVLNIPIPYSRNQNIYKSYGLTSEEISFIESQ